MIEDEMVGQHHRLNGHEFEQALRDGEGQGSLAYCSSWGHRVGHDLVTKDREEIDNFPPKSKINKNQN